MEKDNTKKKTYWLAKVAAWCLASVPIIFFTIFIIAPLLTDRPEESVWAKAIFVAAMAILLASPILAIISLLNIHMSNNTFGGADFAKGVILGAVILMFLCEVFAPSRYMKELTNRMVCGTNITGLGKAIQTYANDNNDQLPDAFKWCDLLAVNMKVPVGDFRCPDSDTITGESAYAMNKVVVGKKLSEIPPDMVLLFETNYGKTKTKRDFIRGLDGKDYKVYKDRWNQVGGPEILALRPPFRPEGSYICFADGKARFFFPDKLASLNWGLDINTVFILPSPQEYEVRKTPIIGIMIFAASVLATASFILCRYWQNKYFLFIIIFGLISTGICSFWGGLIQEIYSDSFELLGEYTGGIAGFIVGISYAAILASTPIKIKQQKEFAYYAALIGMMAGIIFSIILNTVLMIADFEPMPFGMVGTTPYCIFIWTILGGISGSVIRRFFTGTVVEVPNK
jgi:hypothetical protein